MGLLGVRDMFKGTGLGLGLLGGKFKFILLLKFVGIVGELLLLLLVLLLLLILLLLLLLLLLLFEFGEESDCLVGTGESRDDTLLWSLPVELESMIDSIKKKGRKKNNSLNT